MSKHDQDQKVVYVIDGEYTLTASGRRKLERPDWPYEKCGRCGHDLEEHDEDGLCHEPGCGCTPELN